MVSDDTVDEELEDDEDAEVVQLARFDDRARCPVCGYNSIRAQFVASEASSYACRNHRVRSHGDHIHRICSRCGYLWAERPLTASELAELPPPRADEIEDDE